MSKTTIILGSQWGDEGKGKIVDMLATRADIVCRFNGGNNAGHTVIAEGIEYDFHLLPSGIINPKCVSVIGSGTVIHLPDLLKEIQKNEAKGLKDWKKRLYISDRAHLVFDMHQEIDGVVEVDKGKESLGTTKKGIGPTYSSKATRNGIRVCDLMGDFSIFEAKFRALVAYNKKMYATLSNIDVEGELKRYKELIEIYRPCFKDTTFYLNKALQEPDKLIIVEGANAAMLDIDFGTYPYVTSSSCTVGGVCTGLGIPPRYVGETIAIVKAYTTRVGLGAFATELTDDIGNYLQTTGKEVGVTTGRKRRCGWLDLVVLKYSNMLNGYTALAITKLDILDGLEEIKIGVGYKVDGVTLESFPSSMTLLERVEVEYVSFPGWKTPIAAIRQYDQLPANCQAYLKYIEKFLGVPIKYIGVGKEREAVIEI